MGLGCRAVLGKGEEASTSLAQILEDAQSEQELAQVTSRGGQDLLLSAAVDIAEEVLGHVRPLEILRLAKVVQDNGRIERILDLRGLPLISDQRNLVDAALEVAGRH